MLKNQNKFYLLLTIVLGLLFVSTFVNLELLFSEGDQGRDLYCIKHVFDGQKPYQDFWWEYGPLMLYYYALCFKIFGVAIQSVMLGKQVLVFLSGIFIYLATSAIMPPLVAFTAALFFWVFRPDFFYTYNHMGGMLCLAVLLYALFKYFSLPQKRFLILGLVSILTLNLIRLNIGYSSMLAYLLSIYIYDKVNGKKNSWIFYLLAFTGISVVTVLCYLPFVINVPREELLKCFPYLPSYNAAHWTLTQAMAYFIKLVWLNFNANYPRKIFGLLLLGSSARIIYLWRRNQIEKALLGPVLMTLLIFSFLNIHEFLASKFTFRLYWAYPSVVLLFFAIIHFGSSQWPEKIRRYLLYLFAIFIIYCGCLTVNTYLYYKQPINLFEYGPSKFYMANGQLGENAGAKVDHNAVAKWTHTLFAITDYLKAQLKPGEPFLAIPYDSLYYFLSGHDSAVYPLAFFKYINISPSEQINIIRELKQKHVRFVLISNRAFSNDPDLGEFGVDYCVLLKKYIFEHYLPVASFGDFKQISNFQENHGVVILKRRDMLRN